MMLVLDTNVISELMKPNSDHNVERWANRQIGGHLFTTSVTLAEIRLGIAVLPLGRRRTELATTADAIFADNFTGRLLPFDEAAADAYAVILPKRRAAGRPMAVLDAQIAAIVIARGATLVTRNVADFAGCGLTIVDPWQP